MRLHTVVSLLANGSAAFIWKLHCHWLCQLMKPDPAFPTLPSPTICQPFGGLLQIHLNSSTLVNPFAHLEKNITHRFWYLCYYSEYSFNERMMSFCSDTMLSFSLCHINMRSLKANMDDFENYMNMLNIKFSIIGVTETWLNDATRDLYVWDDYELIERHRLNKIGGGIGSFVKTGVSFKYRDDLTIFGDHCESLFIEIDKSVFGSGRDLLIAVIYRPPNNDIKLFIDVLKDVLEKVQLENKLLYLMADYKINLLNVDSHSLTVDFNDTMYSSGLVPLITRPTRVTENSATLIDNIFTNKVVSYDESVYGILVADISDHYPIFCVDKILKHKTIDLSFMRRDYSERTKVHFWMIWHWWIGRMYILQPTHSALFLYSIKKWLIYMTSIFLRNLSQRNIIQESHSWLLVFERQLKRKKNVL